MRGFDAFRPVQGQGHTILAVSRVDWRFLEELYDMHPIWVLRKRGKASHKNRRKKHGR